VTLVKVNRLAVLRKPARATTDADAEAHAQRVHAASAQSLLGASGYPASTSDIARLQRMAGNQAVTRLLHIQRCGGESHAGCACADKQ